jgi:hypothetical protein
MGWKVIGIISGHTGVFQVQKKYTHLENECNIFSQLSEDEKYVFYAIL